MQPTTAVKLERAELGERCARCQNDTEVCAITEVTENPGAAADGYAYTLRLCSLCLAEAVGKVTGFRAKSQLEHWRAVRDASKRTRQYRE